MATGSRVELFAAIRRDARAGMSQRELERTYRVGWRTVQTALGSAWPAPRAAYPVRASKLDRFKPVIDDILVADLDAPRKQRHTVTRIFARLVDEHQMVDVSYPLVRAYVALRKPQIRAERGRAEPGVFVPQTHLPGREAEVDFGEVAVRLRGELVTVHLFSLRMCVLEVGVASLALEPIEVGSQVLGDELVEEEAKHVALEVPAIHRPAQVVGDAPDGAMKLRALSLLGRRGHYHATTLAVWLRWSGMAGVGLMDR